MNIEQQLEFLTRGCVDVTPRDLLKEKLERFVKTGKPLRIKLGVDPTGTDIHLGHTVVLRRLQAFQELGHTIILLIGDYTGMVGDPSGRSETRKMLTQEELLDNAKDYQSQVFKILDKNKTEIRFNSEWLKEITFAGLIQMTSQITVAQMLEREDFNNRYKSNSPISMVEFLYPLMQGYDSVALEADVEFGGQDQIFNLLMGRHLQKYYGQEPQVVMTVPLLEGLDGIRKMSKSYNNIIGVSDTPTDIFGKTMSIPDSLILRYFELTTLSTNEDIARIKKELEEGKNPRDTKMELARILVSLFHNEESALKAQEEFFAVFSKKDEIPVDTPTLILSDTIAILDLLVNEKLVESKSEGRRLIQQGAISLDGVKIDNIEFILNKKTQGVLKVGKRRFLKLIS